MYCIKEQKESGGYEKVIVDSIYYYGFSPILVTAQGGEAQRACEQAKADAKEDIDGTLWFAGTCLAAGISYGSLALMIVGAAYLMEPSPPASKLINKSPEYIVYYKDCYKEEGKSIQTSNAIKGCLLGTVSCCAGYIVYVIAVVSTAE